MRILNDFIGCFLILVGIAAGLVGVGFSIYSSYCYATDQPHSVELTYKAAGVLTMIVALVVVAGGKYLLENPFGREK